jgi:VanZ family protein
MAAIFVVSHQSSVSIPFDAPDYYAHGMSYTVLGFLLIRALAGGDLRAMTWGLVLVATVIGGLYGISDEFHQSFIPGRHPSVSDVIADTVGSLAGAVAGAGLGAWLRRTEPRGFSPWDSHKG